MHIHHVPGRLRVRIAAAKRNAPVARAIERAVSSVPGVTSVRCNELTSSVVIAYECGATCEATLLAALGNGGWNIEDTPAPSTPRSGSAVRATAGAPVSPANKLAAKAAQTILLYALEKAVERSAVRLIAALL